MTRYAMVIDAKHCTGCQTCVVACQMHNALRPGVAWLHMDPLEWGSWPSGGRMVLPRACMHCDEPPCVDVCPTGASRRRIDGIVEIDHAACIGCGVCLAACPYGARTIHRADTWFFGASEPAPYEDSTSNRRGTAEKCTFCSERLERGLEPACVAACPIEARAFGDLDDPLDPVNDYIAQTGAEPIAQTALWCRLPPRAPEDLDLATQISLRRSARESVTAASAQANPTVLAASVTAGAAAVGAIAAAAKHSRSQRHLLTGQPGPHEDTATPLHGQQADSTGDAERQEG